jgi:hypothetical protein
MNIYLYVKTHNKTGLKYLGKTTMSDPHAYTGSGADWKKHLKEHGEDYTTEIICECRTNQDLNKWGRYYSELWNVVESTDWANRIPETGGGSCGPEAAKKISEKLKGRKKPPRNPEHTEKLAATRRGKSNPKTSAGLKKYFDSNPDRSEAIEKQSKSVKEWYKNNPSLSHQKALKTWDGRYRKQYNEYKRAIELVSQGRGVKTIQKETGMSLKKESVEKLRSGEHRIYELFPDLTAILVV